MNILVVSHAPHVTIRTRSFEIASALADRGHTVDVLTRDNQPPLLSRFGKLRWHLRQMSRGLKRKPLRPGLNALSLSAAYRWGSLMRAINRRNALRIAREPYDLIVTAAYDGPVLSPPSGGRLIYDLVDDHADGFRQAGHEAAAMAVDRFIRDQMGLADSVIVSAKVLAELARSEYRREGVLVPNGANVAAVRKAGPALPEAKNRVGYMGGLDDFVNIKLVVDAIQRLRDAGRPIELVVIGDGPAIRSELPPWVRKLGFRPPAEVPELMRQFSVGTVPFELSPFTDAALPLKVIEYGAARKPTVSTPLKELQLQQFPWVTLVSLDVNAWAQALSSALDRPWPSGADAVVEAFDWGRAAEKLLAIVPSSASK